MLKFSSEKIEHLKFLHKLWICANLKYLTFIEWGRNGKTIIIVDTKKLGIYLKLEQSLFKENNFNDFLKRLSDHDFCCVANENPKLMEFRNNDFGRDQRDCLHIIVDKRVQKESVKKPADDLKMYRKARQRDDYCFQRQGVFTDLEINEQNIKVELEHKKGQFMLQKSLEKATNMGMPLPAQTKHW